MVPGGTRQRREEVGSVPGAQFRVWSFGFRFSGLGYTVILMVKFDHQNYSFGSLVPGGTRRRRAEGGSGTGAPSRPTMTCIPVSAFGCSVLFSYVLFSSLGLSDTKVYEP